MIDDSWREFLYPLGFVANIPFGIRVFWQWLQSEKKKESVTPHGYWSIGILGNILLCLHSFIQLQFHIGALSAINGVIGWRHINLAGTPEKRWHLLPVFGILFFSFSGLLPLSSGLKGALIGFAFPAHSGNFQQVLAFPLLGMSSALSGWSFSLPVFGYSGGMLREIKSETSAPPSGGPVFQGEFSLSLLLHDP